MKSILNQWLNKAKGYQDYLARCEYTNRNPSSPVSYAITCIEWRIFYRLLWKCEDRRIPLLFRRDVWRWIQDLEYRAAV